MIQFSQWDFRKHLIMFIRRAYFSKHVHDETVSLNCHRSDSYTNYNNVMCKKPLAQRVKIIISDCITISKCLNNYQQLQYSKTIFM